MAIEESVIYFLSISYQYLIAEDHMSTVNKELAEEIMANDGYYADDERVMQVIKYQNMWGVEAYALAYRRDVMAKRYQASDYVINPEIIWSAK